MLISNLIIFFQCFLVVALLCYLFWNRKKLGLAFLFTAIGVFQFLQIFLTNTFFVSIGPEIIISPGTFVLFYSTLFCLLLVYICEDLIKVRSLIYAIIIANVLLTIFQYTLRLYNLDGVNSTSTNVSSLDFVNFRGAIIGTFLFVLDSVIIFILYEVFSAIFRHLFFRIFITMSIVLFIDNLIFKTVGLQTSLENFDKSYIIPPLLAALYNSILFTIYIYFFEHYKKPNKGKSIKDIYSFIFETSKYLNDQYHLNQKNQLIESKLIESAKQFEIASKIAKLGYWEYDIETQHFILNQHFYNIHKININTGEPIKISVSSYSERFIPEQYQKSVNTKIKNILAINEQKYNRTIEHPIIYDDGTTGMVSVSIFVEKYKSGDYKKIYGVTQDISHLKNIKDNLKISQKRFKSLVENAVDAIAIISKTGKPIYASPAMFNILGYNEDELSSLAIEKDVHPDYVETVLNAFSISLKTPGVEITKPLSKWRRKDGKWIWLKGVFKNMLHDPAINGIIDNFTEVTDVVDYQNELKKQTELRELLLQISTDYINIPTKNVDAAFDTALKDLGTFVNADRAYIFSYDFENNTSTNTHEWVAEDIIPEIDNLQNVPMEAFEEWVTTHIKGEHMYIENVEHLNNLKLKDILSSQGIKSLLTIPIFDNGNCIGFLGFDSVKKRYQYSEKEILLLTLFAEMICNFNNRIKKKEEINSLLKKTTEQNQRLLDFSFMISHNIRASVANIIGLTDIIYESDSNNEFLDMLNESVTKLDYTIKNISDLLNFQNLNSLLEVKPYNVLNCVTNVLSQLNNIIREKQIQINLNIEKNIYINVIPAYLESIVHNLITNAINYGVTENNKQINITGKTHQNHITITIEDFGSGIDLSDDEKKLFNLGSRFHTSSTGLGLGLFTTKTYVETMGGEIKVQSTLNKGTKFILNFRK